MNNDPKLSELLRRWRDLEPPGDFEANVRRRIRLAATEIKSIGFFWRPAFAAAIVISVIIGSSAGVLSSGEPRAEMQFMSAGTLAGGYARLAAEDAR